MRTLFFILAATTSFAVSAQESDDLKNCSQSLVPIEQSLNQLDEIKVNTLVSSVGGACLSSVEFSEWVNELLYAAATERPTYFIKSFSGQSPEIQKNIIKELESPIHDGIDLNKAFNAIKSSPSVSGKSEVLLAIKVAADKIGLTL